MKIEPNLTFPTLLTFIGQGHKHGTLLFFEGTVISQKAEPYKNFYF